MDTDSGYGFLSPARDTSANITSMDLQSVFSTIMVFHTALLLTKEPMSQPGKCDRAMESIAAAVTEGWISAAVCLLLFCGFCFLPSFSTLFPPPFLSLTLDKREKRRGKERDS